MSRKKHPEEHENLERWLVSYADFITLLFAFFTVLYALSQSDKSKYQAAMEGIQRAFLSAGGLFTIKGVPFTPFEKMPDRGSIAPPSPDDIGPMSSVEEKQDEATQHITEQLKGLFKQTTGMSLHAGDVETIRTEKGYRIRLGEYLLFKPGSDRIKRSSLPFLYAVGKRLARAGDTVQVEGHSDSEPMSVPGANWRLSLNRSFNVVQFLIQGVKFPPDRLSLSGYGDTHPIADNTTNQGRTRNRRVELVVTIKDAKQDAYSWEQIDD